MIGGADNRAPGSRLFGVRWSVTRSLLPSIAILAGACCAQAGVATFDGITFYDSHGKLYMPLRQVSRVLDWPLSKNHGHWVLHGSVVPAARLHRLASGTALVDVTWLKSAGAIVHRSKPAAFVVKDAKRPGKAFYVRRGMQRVFVNKSTQTLLGVQGHQVVLRSQISTGMEGHETPKGIFKIQSYRAKIHKSKLFANTPLPWAVQVVGNVFIHGDGDTHSRHSHGCIRLPVSGRNYARWFYFWVEPGTPVTILGKWPAPFGKVKG